MNQFFCQIILALLSIFSTATSLLAEPQLFRPEQAFLIKGEAIDAQSVLIRVQIEPGYYLYRDKFKFTSSANDIEFAEYLLPEGKKKHDEYFGEMQIYRGNQEFTIPLKRQQTSSENFKLSVSYQGCADVGVCYPPQKIELSINLPGKADASQNTGSIGFSSLNSALSDLGLNLFNQDELLPGDQAFQFFAEAVPEQGIQVHWQIAEGYYLYRDKLSLTIASPTTIQLENLQLPTGITKDDAEFGSVQVFYNDVETMVGISGEPGLQTVSLIAKYQGCAELGVCYPPMERKLQLQVDGRWRLNTNQTFAVSEQDEIAAGLKNKSLGLSMLSFFGFGLLLAFTPCVFPMIPILSGIIVGQGNRLNTKQALLLSATYVLASALVYTLFGLLAGLYGANLQAVFQHPLILTAFSLIFVALALSMFGFYDLQLPSSLQSRLATLGSEKAGSLAGAGIMGAFSALIVGPCVAAPLAGALIFIGQTGDAILGGAALFAMGLGMGFPLILIGTSAGKLLPAAGSWMNQVKAVFGVILIAVAIWLMSRVLPGQITLLLWGLLAIISGVFMGALTPLERDSSSNFKLTKSFGLALLAYGLALVLGAAAGNQDPLQPLVSLNSSEQYNAPKLEFKQISSVEELEQQLETAKANGRPVMLDFYADWCVSCIEMEKLTFTDKNIQTKLSNVLLLQADVTANTSEHKALLKHFDLIGPPAILFFDANKAEVSNARVIGFLDAEKFANHLNQVFMQ